MPRYGPATIVTHTFRVDMDDGRRCFLLVATLDGRVIDVRVADPGPDPDHDE